MKCKTPAASPCVNDIPLHGNIAYESYNDEDEPTDNRSYERLDEHNAWTSIVYLQFKCYAVSVVAFIRYTSMAIKN